MHLRDDLILPNLTPIVTMHSLSFCDNISYYYIVCDAFFIKKIFVAVSAVMMHENAFYVDIFIIYDSRFLHYKWKEAAAAILFNCYIRYGANVSARIKES